MVKLRGGHVPESARRIATAERNAAMERRAPREKSRAPDRYERGEVILPSPVFATSPSVGAETSGTGEAQPVRAAELGLPKPIAQAPARFRSPISGAAPEQPCIGPDGKVYSEAEHQTLFPGLPVFRDRALQVEIGRWRAGDFAMPEQEPRCDPLFEPIRCEVIAADGHGYDLGSYLNLWLRARGVTGQLPDAIESPLRIAKLGPYVRRRAADMEPWETRNTIDVRDLIQAYDAILAQPEPSAGSLAPSRSAQRERVFAGCDLALATLVHDALTRNQNLLSHAEPGRIRNAFAQLPETRPFIALRRTVGEMLAHLAQIETTCERALHVRHTGTPADRRRMRATVLRELRAQRAFSARWKIELAAAFPQLASIADAPGAERGLEAYDMAAFLTERWGLQFARLHNLARELTS